MLEIAMDQFVENCSLIITQRFNLVLITISFCRGVSRQHHHDILRFSRQFVFRESYFRRNTTKEAGVLSLILAEKVLARI